MSRLSCLQDFMTAGVYALVECQGCGRRVTVDPERLYRRIRIPWRRELYFQASRLKCSVCRHRGARIAPAPRPLGPLDCPEFQADIDAMWERVMTEEERRKLGNWVIEGPDDDRFVWICSAEGRDDWCRNLGHVDDVAGKFSQWLGTVGHGAGRE